MVGGEDEPLSSAGRRLLAAARDVARERLENAEAPTPLSQFVQIYREWISGNRGRLGTQQEQAEAWQLVCHAIITATDLRQAIGLLIRFGKVVWHERGPCELREEGGRAMLVFSEPHVEGQEGLIASVWQLALTLCELEFLGNVRLREASGQVRHQSCLPDGVVRLLFAPPIAFGASEVALVFDSAHLDRPVVARAADLPRFFREVLPLTLGVRREPLSIATLAAGLIRDDKRGPVYRYCDLDGVATRLGLGASSLRRRLHQEGISFRAIKDRIYNELAQTWLRERAVAIEDVAERLGFSDAFAFRRFFHRLNGQSPSAFRAGRG